MWLLCHNSHTTSNCPAFIQYYITKSRSLFQVLERFLDTFSWKSKQKMLFWNEILNLYFYSLCDIALSLRPLKIILKISKKLIEVYRKNFKTKNITVSKVKTAITVFQLIICSWLNWIWLSSSIIPFNKVIILKVTHVFLFFLNFKHLNYILLTTKSYQYMKCKSWRHQTMSFSYFQLIWNARKRTVKYSAYLRELNEHPVFN
jgi:hypothetical protein